MGESETQPEAQACAVLENWAALSGGGAQTLGKSPWAPKLPLTPTELIHPSFLLPPPSPI